MTTSLRVLDVDPDSVLSEPYHVCLFASGYESRCTHIAGLMNPRACANPIVLGFTEASESEQRARNDSFYRQNWNCRPVPLSTDDERPIYDHLDRCTRSLDGPLRIAMDYSSMSRLWYTAVLNWARLAAGGRTVIVDFLYAMGIYEDQHRPMVIRSMLSIPGCEGRAYRLRESVAVFGLGFHGLAALAVLDRLEADTVYAFLASPGVSEDYVARARETNRELIGNPKTRPVLELPLSSLESCYRLLAQVIAPHRPDGEITLVPMGPKPHVLVSIIIAMRFPEVACLRVTGAPDPADVKASGDIVATRVVVKQGA